MGIKNSEGVQVTTYTYDAFGKTNITSTDPVILFNPLAYRGYVYDRETGLYYLQSRYYNPEWGRFINADDIAFLGASGTLLSNNLFAYCENNSVNKSDFSGHVVTPANVIGAVIGAVGGTVIGNAIANYFGLKGGKRWACTASTSLLLGVVGYFAGPSVYAAIRPVVIRAITTCSLFLNRAQEWILRALKVPQMYINQVFRLVNYNNIRFTNTVLRHLNNPNRSVPVKHLINCIKNGVAKPDPQGTKAVMYTISNFYRNGTRYYLEVLFNWSTMTVQHFKYWR